jgi:tetratricopeptide (TPR) repeat protein
VLNAFNSITLYLTKLLLPLHFSPHYPYFVDVGESITWKDFVPLLSVLGLTLASLFAWTKGHRAWLIAWLFYLVTLSPVLGLIQVGTQGAADRYAYFPTLPAYLLVAAGILTVLTKTTPTRRLLILLVAIPIVFLLAGKTRQQIHVWKNAESFWSHAVKHKLETVKSRHNLGIVYFHQRNYEKAAFNFDRSMKLQSAPKSSLAWRGMSYMYLGRYEEALKDFIELGKLSESMPELNLDQHCIYFNSGWIYAQSGMTKKSAEFFRKVAQDSHLQPDAEVWLNWLENTNHAVDNTSAIEALPGFCETPIPPLMRINGGLQAPVD